MKWIETWTLWYFGWFTRNLGTCTFQWNIFKTFIVTSATLNAEKFSSYFFNCLYTKQPKTDYIDLAFITNHMESSEQEYGVYVIYGHAAYIISCNFCKLDQTHFARSWNLLDMIRPSCIRLQIFFWQEQFRISGRKKFHKFLHDRCVHKKKARTPKPPTNNTSKHLLGKVSSNYTKGLEVWTCHKGQSHTWRVCLFVCRSLVPTYFQTYSISSAYSPFSLLTNLFLHKYLIFISLQTYYSLLTNPPSPYTPPYMLLAPNYVHFVSNMSIIEMGQTCQICLL
jgi:hypothetical protein